MLTKEKTIVNCLQMATIEQNFENTSLDEILSKAELLAKEDSKEAVEKAITLLKTSEEFYLNRITKMEALISELKIETGGHCVQRRVMELSEKLVEIQEKFAIKEVSANAAALSIAYKLRKHNNYTAKLKMCIKMYINLNEALTKKIEQLKINYEQAQFKMSLVNDSGKTDDIKLIETKLGRYEHELAKLEKKHSWLKNPDLDLPNISNEIKALVVARLEKDMLLKELSFYSGLKPNLEEATEQVKNVRDKYLKLKNNYM